jgi:hypothetical protein
LYAGEDVVQGVGHRSVADPKNAHAMAGEDLISLTVVDLLVGVDIAIYFDHNPGGVAVEINDEPADYLLATKVEAGQAIGPKMLPENCLSLSHLPT